MAGRGSATEGQIRKLLSETLVRIGQPPFESPTVRVYLGQWLDECRRTISPRTILKYERAISGFLQSLGYRADSKLEGITTADFHRFRETMLAEGRTPQTANGLVRKVLGVPFLRAFKTGLLTQNPLAALKALKATAGSKGVFSPRGYRTTSLRGRYGVERRNLVRILHRGTPAGHWQFVQGKCRPRTQNRLVRSS